MNTDLIRSRLSPALSNGPGGLLGDAAVRIALALTAFWLLLSGVTLLVLPAPDASDNGGDPLRGIMLLLAVLFPIALIWMAALVARSLRQVRDENRDLRRTIAEISRGGAENPSAGGNLESRVEEIARLQRKTEAALAHLNASVVPRSAAGRMGDAPPKSAGTAAPPAEARQPSLALEDPAVESPPPITTADFIRALNFPLDADDREGFRVLRLAMKDHRLSGLLRSAEDVLTLLAEDEIYVEDLTPDRARPEVWRRFANGERGRGISGLGGLHDREALARTAGRIRNDPVFRDCAHHFLRRFDNAFTEFETVATDEEVAALSETRSARAFMLLGRVAGTFD